jgi:hypothetical protein
MDINRNNYEAFLLDLMEGKLSVSDQQKVRDFLMLNPDCSPSSFGSEPWVLEPEKVFYSGREKLKKELPNADTGISESNFDLFSIARMEGDLTASQEWDHQQMVEGDEERRLEWSQWQQTRLVAREVIYRGKSSLRRKSGVKRGIIWLSVLSSAAAFALLLIFLRVDTNTERTPIAEESSELEESSSRENSDTPDLTVETPSLEEETPTLEKETLALADDPVLFSIKKVTDGPIESDGKEKHRSPAVTQDTLLPEESKLVESRPLRLATSNPNPATSAHTIDYDQIEPLNIPPTRTSITNLTLAQIGEIDVQEALVTYKEEKDISVWSIANAGLKGLNKITGADMSILAARDESGGFSGFRFKSKRFSVASPVERSE